MENLFSSPHFWIALGQIIAVNLALSGNNGVVIALAARSLPSTQRKRAILWGSVAAMGVRLLLTVVAFEVLRLPYMKIVGGALLLWIAVKLLVLDTREDQDQTAGTSIFASAGYVIMLANLAMGLDNVLAIAAAAGDNGLILALGLVISIMIIGFGGTLVIDIVSRFPAIYPLCAALIGYLAGGMLIGDMAIKDWFHGDLHWLQGIAFAQFEVSVPGLIGAAGVFPLAKLYGILTGRGAAGSGNGSLIRFLRDGAGSASAWLSASRILALLPFVVVVAVTFLGHPLYMHYQQRLLPQIGYYGLKLGMTPEEVMHVKGRPAYVVEDSAHAARQLLTSVEDIPKGKTVNDYHEWAFPVGKKEPGSVEITFSGNPMQVAEISCYSKTGYCESVSGISTGASEDEVMAKLGTPHTTQSNNGSQTLDYPNQHLSLVLENKRVSMLRVHKFETTGPQQNTGTKQN